MKASEFHANSNLAKRQVDFALGQVKIEVKWPAGLVMVSSLVSLNDNVSLINENFYRKAISRL